MAYKQKLIILLSIIAALALTYTASLVFDPETSGTRSASYVWLDSKAAARITGITVSAQGERWELNKASGQWFVSYNGMEYPARQLRVDDFISILTAREPYPVRSSDSSSHSRLGLGEDAARVTAATGNGVVLDLLLGSADSTGRYIYLRKYGQNEVRLGENKIGAYIMGSVSSWYNLKLIPESEDGRINADSVQRVSVYSREETQFFSRRNREWIVSGVTVADPDQNSIDSYIRSILNTEGDDFDDSLSANDPAFNYSRIVLELGNGGVKTIRLTEPDESGRLFAHVSNSQYIYSVSNWAAARLFKTAADFEKQ